MKQATKNINAETQAAARKEMGGFAHSIYAASARRIEAVVHTAPPLVRENIITAGTSVDAIIGTPTMMPIDCPNHVAGCEVQHLAPLMIYIEAERFIDARSFACRVLGVSEVDIARLDVSARQRPFPRWQVRYTGSAGGATPLTMQGRLLTSAFAFADDASGWIDTRDL